MSAITLTPDQLLAFERSRPDLRARADVKGTRAEAEDYFALDFTRGCELDGLGQVATASVIAEMRRRSA